MHHVWHRYLFHAAAERDGFIERADVFCALVAFGSSLRMLPMLPRPALWASVALVAAALFCKYGLQGRPGTPAYWWPHALWHLLIAAGQTLLAVALPRV